MTSRAYLVPAGVGPAQVELPAGLDTQRKGALHLRPATVEPLTGDELLAVHSQRPDIAARLVDVTPPDKGIPRAKSEEVEVEIEVAADSAENADAYLEPEQKAPLGSYSSRSREKTFKGPNGE